MSPGLAPDPQNLVVALTAPPPTAMTSLSTSTFHTSRTCVADSVSFDSSAGSNVPVLPGVLPFLPGAQLVATQALDATEPSKTTQAVSTVSVMETEPKTEPSSATQQEPTSTQHTTTT